MFKNQSYKSFKENLDFVRSCSNWDELDKLSKTINEKLARPLWSFTGGGVSDINDFESRMWHMDGLENDDYFKTLFSKISHKLKIKGSLIRCYANGQTATQSGVPHKDDGDITILYFPTPWVHYIGGHLYFGHNNLEKTVEYKQNRLVKFPANIMH